MRKTTHKNPETEITNPAPQLKIEQKLSSYLIHKYNGDQATEWYFNRDGLMKLQLLYHQRINGLPKFIHDFFKGRPSRDRRGVVMFNQLYLAMQASPDSGGILIRPNPIYTTHETLSNPKQLKNSDEGFALVAWFVHPEQLQDTPLKEAFLSGNMQSFSEIIQGRVEQQMHTDDGIKNFDIALRKGATQTELQQLVGSDSANAEWVRENSHSTLMKRSDSQELNEAVEQRSKIKIKVSILDLTKNDIPQLKTLKKTVFEHLEKEYAVDVAQDDVRMHFHFPYQESTSTLHMHIRINQGLHPLDNSRCFLIDDIIKILEQNKDVMDLILERVPFYGDLQKHPDFFSQMNASQEEFSMKVVKNPFKIEFQNGETHFQSIKKGPIARRIFNNGRLFQPYGSSRICLDLSCLTESYATYSFSDAKYGLYLDTYQRLRKKGITPPEKFENRAAFFEWARSRPFNNPTGCINPVIFLTRDQLREYELDIIAFNERTIKTKSGLLAQPGDLGNCITVIDGDIFIAPKTRGDIRIAGAEVAAFNHSSFSSGSAVENSGTLTITDEKKICIDHRSEHYKTRPSKLRALLNLILQKGGNLDGILIGIWIPTFPASDSSIRTKYYPGRYSSENYNEIRLSATDFLAKTQSSGSSDKYQVKPVQNRIANTAGMCQRI